MAFEEVVGIDKPLVIDLAIFHPGIERDKWSNLVSHINFPHRKYNVIHHSTKSWKTDSASIYYGRDQFVRFSSYNSDNDMVPDTATMFTGIGDFSCQWADGDYGWFDYPEILKQDESLKPNLAYIDQQMGKYYQGSGERAAFIMLVIQLLDHLSPNPDYNLWLTKADWELKKQELQTQRNRRRYG